MAGCERMKEKTAPEMLHIIVFVHIVQIVCPAVASVESHGQAFIQTDNELRYMVDSIPFKDIHGHTIQEISIPDPNPVQFDPPLLDFQQQPLGMPSTERVTIYNPDPHNTLHLFSISGRTLHFHCSFFQEKALLPGGNTSFEVVFLARQEGSVENTLYIHTSKGSFKYQVFGTGVPNPYRVRPFLGARLPINSSYSPLIQLHNPHNSILQIQEIYSSGGNLHLELPSGEKEASKELWEIPPFHTKPVMKANFVAQSERNHTAFIRIKTNQALSVAASPLRTLEDVLVLPVEVEVTGQPGLYSPLELLDFGLLRSQEDSAKILQLNLLNSGSSPIHIINVSVSPPNPAISIDFRPVQLQPAILQPSHVAAISFHADKAEDVENMSGRVVVESSNSQFSLSIPYKASVLQGSLVYDPNITLFYTGKSVVKNISRELPITNTFNKTIVVYNVSVSSDLHSIVSVSNFVRAVSLKPNTTVKLLHVNFHPNSTSTNMHSYLMLHTNASIFRIAVFVYNGKLKVVHHRPELFKGQLDFGTLGVNEKRSMIFTLRNENPVALMISDHSSNMQQTTVELLGIEKGNSTTLTTTHNVSILQDKPLVLPSHHYAVFSVNLEAPSYEGTFAAEVIIITQFENLYIPMTLRTAEGSMMVLPDHLVLDKCIPGKLSMTELRVHSSFGHYMEVHAVSFLPSDPRFYYKSTKEDPVLIKPNHDTVLGTLVFDPRKDCQDDCYVGLPTYIPAGHHWLVGSTLDKDVANTDQYLYSRFRQKWQSILHSQQNIVNVTIQLDTSQVRGFLFPAQAHLEWPSLVRKTRIKFPLTQLGNTSISEFIVENPSDQPVIMQLLPLHLYPSPQTIIDLISDNLLTSDLQPLVAGLSNPKLPFTFPDLESRNPSSDNIFAIKRRSLESLLGVKTHRNSLAMMVQGGTKVWVRVGFKPIDDKPHSSLIIIRNNLTILETVVIQGQGGRGDIKFGNPKSNSESPLLFEMTEKHWKSCEKKRSSKSPPPNNTIRRSFTARNTGQLPFYIHGFTVNGSPCDGYGFRVLDCVGFELPPNTTKKIDITFTPDFTMSRIRRTLSLHTSLGPPLNFTLQALVPPHMLSKCAASLPRPSWEPILYYSTVCLISFLLFCTVVAGYFEADRMFTADINKWRAKAAANFDKSKVFDLRNISAGPPGVVKTETVPQKVTNKAAVDVCNGVGEVNARPPSRSVSRTETSDSSGGGLFIIRLLTSVLSPTLRKNMTSSRHAAVTSHDLEPKPHASIFLLPFIKVVAAMKFICSLFRNTSTVIDKKAVAKPPSDISINKDSDIPAQATPNGRKFAQSTSRKTASIVFSSSGSSKPMTNPEYRFDGHASADRLGNDTTPEDEIDEVFAVKEGKRGSKGRGRSDTGRVKDRMLELDRDGEDTSSTTTESSSLEADEKTSSCRDSTPEPPPQKLKKTRTKSKRPKSGSAPSREDSLAADEDFIPSTKPKNQKKIKADPKSSQSAHNLFELPYTMKSDSVDSLPVLPPGGHADKRTRLIKQKMDRGEKPRLNVSIPHTADHTHRLTDSPLPDWASPLDISTVGDLSLLSQQTEDFAKTLPRPASLLTKSPGSDTSSTSPSTSPSPPLAPPLTASYSSVAAASDRKHKPKWTDVAAAVPGSAGTSAEKKSAMTFNGAQASPTSPGVVGNKSSPVNKPASPASASTNPWHISPQLSPVNDTAVASNSFGLQPIQESLPSDLLSSTATSVTTSNINALAKHFMATNNLPLTDLNLGSLLNSNMDGFNATSAAGGLPTSGLTGVGPVGSLPQDVTPAQQQSNSTFMQKLQADRRKRQQEYQRKMMLDEEWPFFRDNAQEPLWDAPATPSNDPWSPVCEPSPKQKVDSLWSPPVNPAPGSHGNDWMPTDSIWGTSTLGMDSTPNPVLDIHHGNGSASFSGSQSSESQTSPRKVTSLSSLDEPASSSASNVASFDPFNTLGNIWNPARSSLENNSWRFPPSGQN